MNKEETLRWLWVAIAVLGTLGLLVGLGAVLLMFFVPATNGDTWGVMLGGVGITSVLLGMGLVWGGVSGRNRSPSPLAYSRWAWLILAFLAAILFALALFVPAERHTQAIFAPLHQGVILLPSLALLFLVARFAGREAAPTLRQVLLAMTGGASSVVMALPLELIAFVLAGLVTALFTAFFPGGQDELERLSALLERWSTNPPTDPAELMALATSPLVLAVAALTLAVLVPMIEEFGKTLILGVMGVWEKPGLARSFTWGAACGLGFAIVEGITNGAMGLGDTFGWAGGVGARVLATAMHALTSGILGLGWGLFWRKRWWALPLAYILAVVYHGLWNFDVVLLIGGAAIGETVNEAGYLLCVLAAVIHLVLLLLLPAGLFGLPLWLRSRSGSGQVRGSGAGLAPQRQLPRLPEMPTVVEAVPPAPEAQTLRSPLTPLPLEVTQRLEYTLPEPSHESAAEDAPTQIMED
ncbi:MAG: PrsW family intramembrane metalloprotease [Anaerolineae bacterium]|nr:PrsW family intramembrane metalloprotease [Anaerolineae bacterium]